MTKTTITSFDEKTAKSLQSFGFMVPCISDDNNE
jgi:hypothetical protein